MVVGLWEKILLVCSVSQMLACLPSGHVEVLCLHRSWASCPLISEAEQCLGVCVLDDCGDVVYRHSLTTPGSVGLLFLVWTCLLLMTCEVSCPPMVCMYFLSSCQNRLSWKGRCSAFPPGVQPRAAALQKLERRRLREWNRKALSLITLHKPFFSPFYMHVCACMYRCMFIHVCTHVQMHVHICVHTCVDACLYMCA